MEWNTAVCLRVKLKKKNPTDRACHASSFWFPFKGSVMFVIHKRQQIQSLAIMCCSLG